MKSLFKRIFTAKTLKTIWILYALFSVIIVLYLTDYLLRSDLNESTDKVLLNDGWNITIDDTSYDNVNLDTFSMPAVDKGTNIIMTRVLPDDLDFTEPALCLHIRQTTVEMFVDGEPIYAYGQERALQGKTVGSGIQLINFSNDYRGKELKIVLQVTEDHAFSRFDSIWLSEWNNSYRFYLSCSVIKKIHQHPVPVHLLHLYGPVDFMLSQCIVGIFHTFIFHFPDGIYGIAFSTASDYRIYAKLCETAKQQAPPVMLLDTVYRPACIHCFDHLSAYRRYYA